MPWVFLDGGGLRSSHGWVRAPERLTDGVAWSKMPTLSHEDHFESQPIIFIKILLEFLKITNSKLLFAQGTP